MAALATHLRVIEPEFTEEEVVRRMNACLDYSIEAETATGPVLTTLRRVSSLTLTLAKLGRDGRVNLTRAYIYKLCMLNGI